MTPPRYIIILLISVSLQQSLAQGKKDSGWIQTESGCKVHNPYPKKKETISWTGDCVDGYASNEGTLAWYENGKLASKYTGALKRGARLGKGTHIFFKENGDTSFVYFGLFANGKRSGEGRLTELKEEKQTIVTEGIFRDGVLSGTGRTWVYLKGKLIKEYEGGFENGAPEGFGTEVYGRVKYVGGWWHGHKNDNGKLYYDSILVYDGAWLVGDFHGIGRRRYFDGSTYYGYFEDNKRHGVGRLTLPNGQVYIGEFKNDLFHGYGFFSSAKRGVVACGEWKNGIILQSEKYPVIAKRLNVSFAEELKALNLSVAPVSR